MYWVSESKLRTVERSNSFNNNFGDSPLVRGTTKNTVGDVSVYELYPLSKMTTNLIVGVFVN